MESANTKIIVRNVRSTDGQVACAVFASPDGFPSHQDKATHGLALPAQTGEMIFAFEGIEIARYAVTVLHDENGNGRLDTNFLGMPREGYGVSAGAFRRFGPPRFAEALVELGPGVSLVIPVRYP